MLVWRVLLCSRYVSVRDVLLLFTVYYKQDGWELAAAVCHLSSELHGDGFTDKTPEPIWDPGTINCPSLCVMLSVCVSFCLFMCVYICVSICLWLPACVRLFLSFFANSSTFQENTINTTIIALFTRQGTIAHDFLVSACCCTHLCAFCQLARQVNILMREGSWY